MDDRAGTAADSGTAQDEIQAWLADMQACVRAVDYERARALFMPDVVGFGTFGGVLDGLDNLVAGQWRNIWPTIRDFTFRVNELRAGIAGSGDLAWVACPWDSIGTREDGTAFPRPGRMTIILIHREGRWRAAHTHFSLYPPTATAHTG